LKLFDIPIKVVKVVLFQLSHVKLLRSRKMPHTWLAFNIW